MIMAQPEREILWIVDIDGNNGKSFLASYLPILYGFHPFDGLVNSRDTGSLLKSSAIGFCFDVTRSTLRLFDYGCLESIKNGYVVSGKHRGSMKRFQIKLAIVLSNFYPGMRQLSQDRWCVRTLGKGEFSDLSKFAVVSPSEVYIRLRRTYFSSRSVRRIQLAGMFGSKSTPVRTRSSPGQASYDPYIASSRTGCPSIASDRSLPTATRQPISSTCYAFSGSSCWRTSKTDNRHSH